MTSLSHTHDSASRSSLFASVFGFFAGVLDRMEQRAIYRSTIRELNKLSDRDLRDIGLIRGDIERVARESVNMQ